MPGPSGAPYVTPAELPQYVPAATVNLATEPQQLQACLDATEEIDSYLRGRFGQVGTPLVLVAWGNDVTRMTAYIALYLLATGPIGYAPQAGADDNIGRNYDRAIAWGKGVQRQAIHPDVTPQLPDGADPLHDAPQVSSQPVRGWQMVRGGRSVIGGF
jgi:phage gp36-like protein